MSLCHILFMNQENITTKCCEINKQKYQLDVEPIKHIIIINMVLIFIFIILPIIYVPIKIIINTSLLFLFIILIIPYILCMFRNKL